MKLVKLPVLAFLIASLVVWPFNTQAAVVACSTSGCTTFQTAVQNNTLSTAVINSATQSLAAAFNAAQNNTLTTTQLSEAKANMQTLFNYLNSEGWVDYMNQSLAAQQSNLTADGFTPTASQVTTVYNALVAQGATMSQT